MSTVKDLNQPLSNTQLEILKAFSHHLNEIELKELRSVIAQYFAKRAIAAANKVWDEKKWTNQDVDRMLNTKIRLEK
jgi:hypothetical protein